jgi:hypothetical protein
LSEKHTVNRYNFGMEYRLNGRHKACQIPLAKAHSIHLSTLRSDYSMPS